MKAEDLKLDELIEFGEGRLSLHERRLVLHDLHAFAQLQSDLAKVGGRDHARGVLTRFGYFWGEADAAAMKRLFTWDSVEEWLRAGSRLHTLQGAVKSVVESLTLDPETGQLDMRLIWRDSGEAEEHLICFGPSDRPVCWMLAGYASGYASYCLNKEIFFIEQTCVTAGDSVCTAIGKDRASWGDELKSVLPYFQTEDIAGKIKELSRELKQKTLELAKERQRLHLLEGTLVHRLVEVHSAAFRRVVEVASRVAPYDSCVLVTGESGTGKEVLSRYIHENSHRSSGPFVTVNCAALPETLLESELFGHKAGAFTGAIRDRVGLFEEGANGTVFLDEIGDISLTVQMKLLRVLQEREITRVGESKPRKVDVRVIAATHRTLLEEVEKGTFREDLFYRLRVIEIEVPPLRERREDILHLARHFAKRFSRKMNIPALRLDATCIQYLQAYPWPGNVRELENAIERAAVFSSEGLILPEHLPPQIIHEMPGTPQREPLSRTLADVELDHIHAVMATTGGNKTRAAKLLGISPATLWRKLKPAP
jgi:two-component system, NtrC family, response regulator HydG